MTIVFKDVLFMLGQDELHIYDYFTREFLDSVKLGQKLQIECYDEMVYLSGELKKDSMTDKLFLHDRNGFTCYVEYGQVYEKVWILND